MSHALVIGGTGMLREVSVELSRTHDIVSVVARSETRLNALARQAAAEARTINPIPVDYRHESTLRSALERAVHDFGAVTVVVSWIHGVAPSAHRVVAGLLSADKVPCTWYDVLGSAVADPSVDVSDRELEFRQWANIVYRSVVLGFVVDGKRSRWLTNDEIGSGVNRAIRDNSESAIVGQVRPWHMRP